MYQSIALPAFGHPLQHLRHFTRLFHSALLALAISLLTAGVAGAQEQDQDQDDSAAVEKAPLINLNTADSEALQYIPGIGPGRAADIIRMREQTGGFKAVEDLLAIPGIGEKRLMEIAKFGSVDGGVSALTEEMVANPPRMQPPANADGADEADGAEDAEGLHKATVTDG